MKPITWFLGKGLAAVVSCAVALMPMGAVAADCPSGDNFSDRVYELAPPPGGGNEPPFSAVGYGSCFNAACAWPPPRRGNPSGYRPNLQAAFDLAPPFFKSQLCTLETIFIVADPGLQRINPSVWGMRERARNLKRHVAISQAILMDPNMQDGQHPYAYYETFLAHSLLPLTNGSQEDWGKKFYYSSSDSRQALAILDILAHEMGHINWVDKLIYLNPYQGVYFTQYSWGNSPAYIPLFHDFGQDLGYRPAVGPGLYQVISDLQSDASGQFTAAANDLQSIYGGQWTGLFATEAPDEDFVETFKTVVLTDRSSSGPALQSAAVHLPAMPPNILIDLITLYTNPAYLVYSKAQWIRGFLGIH